MTFSGFLDEFTKLVDFRTCEFLAVLDFLGAVLENLGACLGTLDYIGLPNLIDEDANCAIEEVLISFFWALFLTIFALTWVRDSLGVYL